SMRLSVTPEVPTVVAKPSTNAVPFSNYSNDPMVIPGQVTRDARPDEIALYRYGYRRGWAEAGRADFADGSTQLIEGTQGEIQLPGGPDVIATSHTHPNSAALFSRQDVCSALEGGYPADAVHSVIGPKWPNADWVLRIGGDPDTGEFVTTSIEQSRLIQGQ